MLKSTSLIPKKSLRKYLFNYKVPLSYKNVINIYHACLDEKDPNYVNYHLDSVPSHHLMTLKRILESYRKKSGILSKTAIQVENNLVEKASEMGDYSAIALLCGRTLNDNEGKEFTLQDRNHANKLLSELMDKKFPLAFKISGDLAYQRNFKQKAAQFYKLAIDNGIESDNSLYVECLRNIALIHLMNKETLDLVKARRYFDMAVTNALDVNQVSDCHYYLAQILEKNQHSARYHFEKAASTGLQQAFAPLGFLLLNYFNKIELAKEWFELGSSMGDLNCHTGLFDTFMKLQDYKQATIALDKIKKNEKGHQVIETRKDLIQTLQRHQNGPTDNTNTDIKERWNF